MKKNIKKLGFALAFAASINLFTGCMNDDSAKDEPEAAKTESPLPEDASSYGDITVFTIDNSEIKLDEVMWYVYLMEDEFREDATIYEEQNGLSYYDIVMDDDGNTVRDKVREEIIDMIYYYELMYSMAVGSDLYSIEDDSYFDEQAQQKMEEVSDSVAEKCGLTKETYKNILYKWAYTDWYYEDVSALYDVDSDELMSQTYSEDELESFSDEEYESKAELLEKTYRQQLFMADYELIQADHEIVTNEEIWNAIDIGNCTTD